MRSSAGRFFCGSPTYDPKHFSPREGFYRREGSKSSNTLPACLIHEWHVSDASASISVFITASEVPKKNRPTTFVPRREKNSCAVSLLPTLSLSPSFSPSFSTLCIWSSRRANRQNPYLSEAKGQVAHRLRQGLDAHGLVVCEAMVLRLHACVIHQGSGVGDEAAHCRSDVIVNLHDLKTTHDVKGREGRGGGGGYN